MPLSACETKHFNDSRVVSMKGAIINSDTHDKQQAFFYIGAMHKSGANGSPPDLEAFENDLENSKDDNAIPPNSPTLDPPGVIGNHRSSVRAKEAENPFRWGDGTADPKQRLAPSNPSWIKWALNRPAIEGQAIKCLLDENKEQITRDSGEDGDWVMVEKPAIRTSGRSKGVRARQDAK